MFDIEAIRREFPMLNQKMQGHNLVYFDNGATSLKPKCVIDSIVDYYSNFSANAHRGDYDIAHKVDEEFDRVRHKVANFINCEDNEVIFTSGCSMSLNMVAFGYGIKHLKEDDVVLITEAEHASNVLPWYRVSEITKCKVEFIPLDEEGKLTVDNLKKVLTTKVKIVSLAYITNVLGYDFDIKEFSKLIHDNGSIFVVDGAQSVPHMKTDVKDIDADFLAFSGHKMCGPTGIGVLYGKYSLLSQMDAFITGGGMNTTFDMCGNIGYQYPPTKFEAGTPAIAEIIGLGAAIDFLESIGMDEIEKRERELKEYAIKKLKEVDIVKLYNASSKSGIITFNIDGVFAQDTGSLMNSYGIAVRSGLHCAKILVNKLGVDATVRASLYFYNTFDEIDIFVEACKKGKDFLDAFFN